MHIRVIARALYLISLTFSLGCALFRPLPDPVDRTDLRLKGCVSDAVFLSRYHRGPPETCPRERAAYCQALGKPGGCREGREKLLEYRNELTPPPNLNHVGP